MPTGSTDPLDTITVALTDSVDLSHAPVPTNDSERLVFRQLFETLVTLDCRGEIGPGLAASWSQDSSGRTWTFDLRERARLADGSAATAPALVSTWVGRRGLIELLGIDSVVALDQRRVAVTLYDLGDSTPRLFAEPALAITHTVDSAGPSSPRTTAPGNSNRPVLDFQVAPGSDPRDALDRGADLLVTRDPVLLDYAVTRREFTTVPLPWSRTYVLLQTPGAEPMGGNLETDSVRQSLARDAVRADARPASPPFWWNGPCTVQHTMQASRPTSARIVYPRRDEVARGLAERIVALASGGAPLRAVGLDQAAFDAALGSGSERAYVIGLPRQSVASCRDSAALTRIGSRIQPLIDTRAHAIVRVGAAQLAVDWDGTIRVLGDNANGNKLP